MVFSSLLYSNTILLHKALGHTWFLSEKSAVFGHFKAFYFDVMIMLMCVNEKSHWTVSIFRLLFSIDNTPFARINSTRLAKKLCVLWTWSIFIFLWPLWEEKNCICFFSTFLLCFLKSIYVSRFSQFFYYFSFVCLLCRSNFSNCYNKYTK